MSRKGNCLDNAPIESFFHLLKTECLNGFPQCKDIGEFKEITKNYVDWFNNRRISQKRQIARNNLNKFSNADHAKRSQSVFTNLNI